MEHGITWGELLLEPLQHWMASLGVDPERTTLP